MRIGIFTVVLLSACTEELESPSPALDSVEPALACNEQFISTLTVNGQRMTPLPVDLATPEPQLILPHLEASKISELDGSAGTSDAFDLIAHTRWLDANTMEIDIDPEMGLPDGAFGLNLENADGQRAELNPAMAIVPPPTASAIDPDRVCLDQGDVSVSLTGEGFLVVDGVLPTVDIGGTTVVPDGAEDCFDIAAAAPSAVQSCNALPVTLAQDLLTEGLYDVILTNPTHYSVALRYDRTKDAAPTVVAKGVDDMAMQIRKIAREHDVPLMEDPPLTRALYRAVKVGQAVPEKFYQAVATVLSHVYRLHGRTA